MKLKTPLRKKSSTTYEIIANTDAKSEQNPSANPDMQSNKTPSNQWQKPTKISLRRTFNTSDHTQNKKQLKQKDQENSPYQSSGWALQGKENKNSRHFEFQKRKLKDPEKEELKEN